MLTGKIYTPEVIEADWSMLVTDGTTEASSSKGTSVTTSKTAQVFEPPVVDKTLPEVIVARQLLSESMDTQRQRILGSYEFTQTGAIQIGTYIDGESGDVRISGTGILGRDENGVTTFSLDATTGDATFLGTVAAGSFIAGSVGTSAQVTLDGANNRILVNDGTNDRILIGYQLNGF